MTKRYNKEFKLNAIHYYEENKKLGMNGCAKNLGIAASTLGNWIGKFQDAQYSQDAQETQNTQVTEKHGSFNYALVNSKDIEQFIQKIRHTQDSLDDLKKKLDSWETTVAIFAVDKTETD
jgi:transposase